MLIRYLILLLWILHEFSNLLLFIDFLLLAYEGLLVTVCEVVAVQESLARRLRNWTHTTRLHLINASHLLINRCIQPVCNEEKLTIFIMYFRLILIDVYWKLDF